MEGKATKARHTVDPRVRFSFWKAQDLEPPVGKSVTTDRRDAFFSPPIPELFVNTTALIEREMKLSQTRKVASVQSSQIGYADRVHVKEP